jgi:hypothetical protein
MLRETKGAAYKPVMRTVVVCCALSHMKRPAMHKWFLGAKESFRMSRLRGWRAWVNYCGGSGITLDQLKLDEMPEMLYSGFLDWADIPSNGVTQHVKKDATPAVQEFYDLIRRGVKLGDASYIRTLKRNVCAVVKAAPKNATIWLTSWGYRRQCLWLSSLVVRSH